MYNLIILNKNEAYSLVFICLILFYGYTYPKIGSADLIFVISTYGC